ncbi:hypothetical protein [Helicobacter pylori]|nr:hypothetical protein [Helicobacter pylori]
MNAANLLQYSHTFVSSVGSVQSYALLIDMMDMMRESCKECVGDQAL